VQLAHARDDELAGLLVLAKAEARILVGDAGQRLQQRLAVAQRSRLDGLGDDRLVDGQPCQQERVLGMGEGVAGARLLEAEQGAQLGRPRRRTRGASPRRA
jgi:hypothetical protein